MNLYRITKRLVSYQCEGMNSRLTFMRLTTADYKLQYSDLINEQLTNLEMKCPQGSNEFLILRKGLFKSRYDIFGNDQALWLCLDNKNVVGTGAVVCVNRIIDSFYNIKYKEAHHLDLRIDPLYQRRGIGSNIAMKRHEWSQEQQAHIATVCLVEGNRKACRLHEHGLNSQKTQFFKECISFFSLKLNEINKLKTTMNKNIKIEISKISNPMEQKRFLKTFIPQTYVLYPDENDIDKLIDSEAFEMIYIARICNKDEFVSLCIYNGSKIMSYQINGELLDPLSLFGKISTISMNDNGLEEHVLNELLMVICQEYNNKRIRLICKQRNAEIYSKVAMLEERVQDADVEYYTNSGKGTDNSIYDMIQSTVNATSKCIWTDPRQH
eukprot:504932_1